MTQDIVARLRRAEVVAWTEENEFDVPCGIEDYDLAAEAADEVETLRRENREAREELATACRHIARWVKWCDGPADPHPWDQIQEAKAFLEQVADSEEKRILAMSDEAILREARENGDDTEAFAQKMRDFVRDERQRLDKAGNTG